MPREKCHGCNGLVNPSRLGACRSRWNVREIMKWLFKSRQRERPKLRYTFVAIANYLAVRRLTMRLCALVAVVAGLF